MSDISDPGPTDLNTTELVRRWFPDVSAPNARRLEGGWMNDVFALDTDAGPFVLRLLQPEATEEMTAWSHGLLDRIAPRVPTVLAPLRTPTGASYVPSEDRLATLERFVNGRLGTRTGARPCAGAGAEATSTARSPRSKTSRRDRATPPGSTLIGARTVVELVPRRP